MVELSMLAISLALVAACGVFVTAEFAFVTVSRPQVDRAVAEDVRGAAGVQTALRSLSTQLSGAQIGITLTNLAIGYLAEPSIAALVRGPLADLGLGGAATSVSWAIALVTAAAVTMVFGELVPKNLAIAQPLRAARAVQLPQRAFTAATRPLTATLNRSANLLVRAVGIEPQEELASAHSPSELVSLLDVSAQAGSIEPETASIVQGSLRLDDKFARDVMTPRTLMVTTAGAETVQQVVDRVRQEGFSRLPVTGEDIDDVVGLTEIGHAVAVAPESRARTPVSEITRPVLTVPDTLALDDLLWALRDHGSELAVVLDEYGGTAGLVTFEDIVEEVVGQVADEHDPPVPRVERLDDTTLRVAGLVRPDELRDSHDVRLPEGDHRYETVAGLVMDRLDRVPAVGDSVDVEGVRLEVAEMDGQRVEWLLLRHHPQESDGE